MQSLKDIFARLAGQVSEWDPVSVLVAGATLVLTFFITSLVRRVLQSRLKAGHKGRGRGIDHGLLSSMLSSMQWSVNLVALYSALRLLPLDGRIGNFVGHVFLVVATFLFTSLSFDILKFSLDIYLRRRGSTLMEHKGRMVLPIFKGVVWLLALAFILDNFGVKVSAILAGLGVAGVAVGFAAQAILGDLFSYFAILFDRPFRIGDFIVLGPDLRGTIEHIGLKTSRIRSLDGELIIMSNSDLTNSRVHNYRPMIRRRVLFGFGVLYSTPSEKLEQIPQVVRDIIEEVNKATCDRVHFCRFGDSSLDFEVVYYVESPDYNDYMDVQQTINLELVRRFEDMDVDFAFPTRTVHMQQQTGE